MIRKTLMAAVAALALLASMFVSVTPANAAWASFQCRSDSGTGWTIEFCGRWEFKVQADGTGVKSLGIQMDFVDGCPGDTESNPTDQLSAVISSSPQVPLNQMVDCSAYRTYDYKGNDTGPSTAVLLIPVNVDNAGDYTLAYSCTLRTDLTSTCSMTRP